MKKVGRSKDNALLRTLANKKFQNFATKRILRDLKEIESETIPTIGVIARPLENDLFTWHANIQGPKDTVYQDGVFHFSITLPESYPHQPPSVELLTPFPHPNVFGNTICLDMLNPQRGSEGGGWSSGYSIQSVLLQLQSFLFEKQYKVEEKRFEATVQQAITLANNYKCNGCKRHGGKLSAWPEFPKKEVKEEEFIVLNFDEKSSFSKELVCYHTKQSFKDLKIDGKEDIKGACLGVGLTISKVPRTGAIHNATVTLDYLNIKAFIKEGIRWSSNNEKFTHWLPLYFGSEDNQDRALHLGKKSLAMIMANSTKRFKPEFILEIFPKIIVTTILQMIDQKRHSSIVIIKQLAHIHANFLLYLETYPELYDEIEKRLQNFIKDESRRIKDHTPNLAVLMAYLFVSPKTKFADLIEPYHNESLDRQVFWILRSVPELADEKNIEELNEERAALTFKCQKTSFQILSLFKHYIFTVSKISQNPKELFKYFQNNFCKLENSIENEIQQGCFQIQKSVNSFNEFYSFIGLKEKSISELNVILKQAIKGSKQKKYHGQLDEIHTLPTSNDQIKALLTKIPKLEDFYEVRTIKIDKDVKIEHKLKKNFTEEEWKIACTRRWQWIKEAIQIDNELTSTEIAQYSISQFQEGGIQIGQKKNALYNNIEEQWRKKDIPSEQDHPKILLPEHTWQQVFYKLDLEDSLLYFDQNPDFQTFYEKLEIVSEKIIALTIPVIPIKNVKSGFHYLTQVISKLTNLQFLEISGLPEVNSVLTLKAIKCVNKGLSNFLNSKGNLKGISFYKFTASGSQAEITDKIFSPLSLMKNLVSIKFSSTNLLHMSNASKSLGNIITTLKSLEELVLNHQVLNTIQQAKEIADGLMRAVSLRIVNIQQNTSIGFQGLAAIIYNLAFAQRLNFLNISQCSVYGNGTITDVVEALFKLLKINASIEILDCSNISSLNQNLSKDFFVHLGEIKTLKYVDFENSGNFNDTVLTHFGKAIAFNAKKGGQITHINMKNTIHSSYNVTTLYKNMNVSEHDHEIWYGDHIKASKMTGDDHKKVFYNNLKALQFDNCNGIQSSFNINDFTKYNREDPDYIKLLARSPKLESLLFSGCTFQKNDADMLSIALDPRRKNFASNIKVLNLSKNNIGKEGAKIIASIFEYNNIIEVFDLSKNAIGVSGGQEIARCLEKNTSLKFLNLFNNKIGYDGAEAFKKTLSVNSTLEFIEFGHNRIRNQGLLQLADGIAANKQSKIHSLGLRFNFLNEDGIIDFLKTVKNSANLKEIFIKNNSINEYGLFQLKRSFDNLKLNINVDIFEKLQFLDEEKLERTVYVHPIPVSRHEIKVFFEQTQKCGIVIDVRIRKGPKWPNRTQQENKFAMVEFADATSTTRALTVASRKKSNIAGKTFRIYKAGTGTFLYQKKTSKQKKAETSKTNIPKIEGCANLYGDRQAPTRVYVPPARGGRGGKR